MKMHEPNTYMNNLHLMHIEFGNKKKESNLSDVSVCMKKAKGNYVWLQENSERTQDKRGEEENENECNFDIRYVIRNNVYFFKIAGSELAKYF